MFQDLKTRKDNVIANDTHISKNNRAAVRGCFRIQEVVKEFLLYLQMHFGVTLPLENKS
ncbi:MAG TPA: hypothetical protein VG847_01765 [Chitinophagaceae bacterium]|nr:hypothetical protein [Chitinophagaceae bacterium]